MWGPKSSSSHPPFGDAGLRRLLESGGQTEQYASDDEQLGGVGHRPRRQNGGCHDGGMDELRRNWSRIERERKPYRNDQRRDERREKQNPIPLPHVQSDFKRCATCRLAGL